MKSDRFLEILESYGASPSRWPEAERQKMLTFLEKNEQAQQILEEAASLDALLDQVEAPMPSPELMADILLAAQASPRFQWATILWPFGPLWKPAAGLAAAAIIGLSLGSVTPYNSSSDIISSEIEFLIQD